MTLAFRCLQGSVAYRTSTVMAEKSEAICSKGETFFGKRVTAKDGSLWLCNESKNLFLPLVHPEKKTEMFEEVHYTCTFKGTVQARDSPELSDTCEAWVKNGQSISALPVFEQPGWLIEADSKLYYPMNNPKAGDAIFEAFKATGDVEQGRQAPQASDMDDPSCEQVATAVSVCIPLVGCVTFCVSAANNKEGSNKRKWGNIACGVGTASFVVALALNLLLMSNRSTYYTYSYN
eukprot:Skav216795  [mRNA]  locus=scaffold2110:1480:2181:- [translate_table: standard]